MEIVKDVHDQMVDVFGADTLWVADKVKAIMQKNGLDYRDKSLTEAILTVAVYVGKRQTEKI